MTNLLKTIQKSNFFWGKIILFILILASSIGPVKAQAFNNFLHLTDGPLSSELWDLVLGDLSDWQVIGGCLQGQLLPPPAVSSYKSAIAPKAQFWPVKSNYQLSFDFTPLDGADKNFGILFDYKINSRGKVLLSFLSFHFINQQLYVENFENHFLTHRTLVPCPLEPGKTYRFHLVYQKPDFEFFVDERLFFSSKNDQDFWPNFLKPGRPLFYLSRGDYQQSASIYSNFNLDYFPQLTVPYFSQLDSNWAESIYDHSQEFFNPALTIASSGCALSSAAMLLNYYAYDTFPNEENWSSDLRGKAINPETLNIWLKNEADGYLGLALVNWLAITRLSSLLAASTDNSDKVLEFAYTDYQANTVSEQLKIGQPLIADLGAHFVVISGIVEDDESAVNTYLINDPIDSDHTILDHVKDPIESLRIFKASQTDLSYWLLLSPEKLNFKLVSKDENQELEAILSREKNLLNLNQDYYLYYWPQPNSGEYTWQFSASDLEKLKSAQLFIYQSDGLVQIFNLADYLARELKLTFIKDQLSELSINQNKNFFLYYHQYLLNRLLQLQREQYLLGQAQNANRYQKLIEYFLDFYQL